MKQDYCTNEGVESCRECSFSSYGRDCMNAPIVEDKATESIGEDVRKIKEVSSFEEGISYKEE